MKTVDDSLFTEDRGALLGSRCTGCGAHTFPRQRGCPRCTGSSMADVPLSRKGTLWSWTVQGFRPKTPYTGADDSYGVGYVELPGQLIVETRLTENDPAKLRIGMPMELVLVPFRDDLYTFAFREVRDA